MKTDYGDEFEVNGTEGCRVENVVEGEFEPRREDGGL